MKKIDYKLKSEILSSTIYQDYLKYKRLSNRLYVSQHILTDEYSITTDGEIILTNNGLPLISEKDLSFLEEYKTYLTSLPNDLYKEMENLYHSRLKRTCRLKKRITKILLTGECLFLTLTFANKVLSNTSDKTRRTYVTRFLNSFNVSYVANIDFGKKKGREHYHAVIGIGFIDYSLWSYGNLDGLKIRNSTKDITKIAKYISKLTNHAIKETTKRSVLIYSR